MIQIHLGGLLLHILSLSSYPSPRNNAIMCGS